MRSTTAIRNDIVDETIRAKSRGILTPENVADFVRSGHATITLVSGATGNRFTYRVDAPSKRTERGGVVRIVDEPIRFVSVMYGRDNESNFRYIGYFRGTGDLSVGRNGDLNAVDDVRFRAFKWFWQRASVGLDYAPVEAWHEGRCGRCGRKLTVPDSISRGIGPECAARVGS